MRDFSSNCYVFLESNNNTEEYASRVVLNTSDFTSLSCFDQLTSRVNGVIQLSLLGERKYLSIKTDKEVHGMH